MKTAALFYSQRSFGVFVAGIFSNHDKGFLAAGLRCIGLTTQLRYTMAEVGGFTKNVDVLKCCQNVAE